ncbi:MAG: glycogen debranching N-terminal domain-containing protein [Thermoleophilaceae bacterium]
MDASTDRWLVIKRENLFLLAPRDGSLPGGGEQPLGLWYRDCRFLSGHELRPGGLGGTLRIERPWLPRWVGRLEVEGLRVAGASVDLRFERAGSQVVLADARVEGGPLELVLESGIG